MRCAEASELMSVSLDTALTAGQRRMLNEHLSGCSVCQDEWIMLHRLSALLSNAPLAVPPVGFATQVMHRLARRQSRPRLILGLAFLLLGAAVLMVTVGLPVLPLAAELWLTANTPGLSAGAEVVLSQGVEAMLSLVQAAWVITSALLTAWRQPLVMSYLLLVLLLTTVWVGVVKLRRQAVGLEVGY